MTSATYPPPGTESEIGLWTCCQGICRKRTKCKPGCKHGYSQSIGKTSDNATKCGCDIKIKNENTKHKPTQDNHITKPTTIEKYNEANNKKSKLLKHITRSKDEDDLENVQKNIVIIITKIGKKGFMCSALKITEPSQRESNSVD